MNEVIKKHEEEFKAACARLNISDELPSMPNLPQSMQEHHQASHMLMVFHADKKIGKKSKHGDPMFFPWWYRADSAGSGFRLDAVTYVLSYTSVGAPFESLSRDDANELTEKYQDLYEIKMRPLSF